MLGKKRIHTGVAGMVQIRDLFSSIGALFTNLFEHPDWRNIVDVAILASTNDLYNSGYEGEAKLTQTFYERMFLAEGKPITYLKFYIN